MAKIWGQDGTGWTQVQTTEQSFSAGAFGFAAGYAALATGFITSFNLWVGTGGSAAHVQIVLYTPGSPSTGGATYVGQSNVYTNTNPGSLINIPCSTPIPVTSGTIYAGFISTDTGSINSATNSGSSAFVDSQYNSTHFPYASPPGTTFNPRDSGTGRETLLWGDYTPVGPQQYVVVGQPGIWSWGGGGANFNASASTVVNGGIGAWSWNGFSAIVKKNGQNIGPVGGGNYRRRMHRRS
jgi:hypothetical protein